MTMMLKGGLLAVVLCLPVCAAAETAIDPADAILDAALAAAEACPQDVLDLTAVSAAQMDVMLYSPCHAGERVVLDHAGVTVTVKLSANGALFTALPVLGRELPVTATFANGAVTEAYLAPPPIAHIQDTAAHW